MKVFLVVAMTILGSSVFAADATTGLLLNFRGYASVEPGQVKVSDILTRYSRETNGLRAFGDIVLGQAPKAGETIRFSDKAISLVIAKAASQMQDPVLKKQFQAAKIEIPREIRVEGATLASSIKAAKIDLIEQAEEQCSGCQAEVEEFNIPGADRLSPESRIHLLSLRQVPKGSFNIEGEALIPGKSKTRVWIVGSLRLHREVPVATRLLMQGNRIAEGDFEIRRMDITNLNDTAPLADALLNAKLDKTISPNQVILNSFLARDREVVFGQPIKAILKSDSWQVTVNAIARDAGSIGDRVKVFNPASNKLLSGIVVSRGVVEIK